MSVVIKMVVVPIHVQTLMEASLVDATLDIYWTVMDLLAMVNIT